MKRFLHIVTVGTSIVRNAKSEVDKALKEGREHPLVGYADLLEKLVKARPGSSEDREAALHVPAPNKPMSKFYGLLRDLVYSDPKKYSAELNAILSYTEYLHREQGVEEAIHEFKLYTTDSWVCALCGHLIKSYLSMRKFKDVGIEHDVGNIDIEKIRGWGTNFWLAIIELIKELEKDLSNRKEYDQVFINLTGGFKPETGFLIWASSLFGVDLAYYIHENIREIVELPLIRTRIAHDYAEILERVKDIEPGKIIEDPELTKLTRRIGILHRGRLTKEAIEFIERILEYKC
ncbi:MAG: hypothetical protein B6U89_01180 [Desulfurococcales archaeon ex4484_58]|nr:MAG: hypothetical protein B6U89_01180 [Desulfurococcales archaeon ex4484_58]